MPVARLIAGSLTSNSWDRLRGPAEPQPPHGHYSDAPRALAEPQRSSGQYTPRSEAPTKGEARRRILTVDSIQPMACRTSFARPPPARRCPRRERIPGLRQIPHPCRPRQRRNDRLPIDTTERLVATGPLPGSFPPVSRLDAAALAHLEPGAGPGCGTPPGGLRPCLLRDSLERRRHFECLEPERL
jgi:hypothetical protein